MKKALSMIVLASAGFGLISTAHAAPAEAKVSYDASMKKADVDYKMAKEACDSHKDNAKDICVKEAKVAQAKANGEAEGTYKNTDAARKKARTNLADANYELAKEKCDDMNGNNKDVCVKEAKAAKTAAVADAKANKEVTEAKQDAREEKHDANMAVKKEKCDAMTGAEKSRCMSGAK